MSRYAHIAYTPAVQAVQQEMGSGPAGAHRLRGPVDQARLSDVEATFLQRLDGFILGSVSETGWPYLQYRGGPPGFLHVLDDATIGWADVRGNRQYITLGNLRTGPRVSLFCLDQALPARLKIYGRATAERVADVPELADRLGALRSGGRVEHIVTVRVEAFDWNCQKHITRRYSVGEIPGLAERIEQLETENVALRAELSRLRSQ
jgi:predicted pyridoxine 5'-phosphate oxidase superfamily flavin-nucleotide-binding protein